MNALEQLKAASQTLASSHPELQLLVLFGSRARGEEDPSSDWDFAFLSTPPLKQEPFWFPGSELLNKLSDLLHIPDDKIDIVDLSHCSEILAHFVARDGQVIYEEPPGIFAQFQQRALKTSPELKEFRRSQREQVLQALQRWGV